MHSGEESDLKFGTFVLDGQFEIKINNLFESLLKLVDSSRIYSASLGQ